MNLISIAIHRPAAVTMFFLAILFTGMVALGRLPLDLTPDVNFPKLSVVTYWPDTSPETVEAFVTSPIEAAANTVKYVKKVDSISEEGKSTVNIEFARGVDMDFAALELNEKLSLLHEDLPFGVQPPEIQKYVPEEFQKGRFLSYHLTGNFTLPELRKYALERLRGPLLAVEGVADVQVLGGQDREVQIELNPEKLQALGLSEDDVRQALTDLNLRMAAGKLYLANRQHDLIVEESLTELQQISKIILVAGNGSVIRVKEVADISWGYSQPANLTRINGNPAVVLNIEKEVGSNTIAVADRVFARLTELQKDFPPSLRLIKERDQSEQIRSELANLSSRAGFCVAVIFLVLLIFLRDWHSSLLILASIFFSILLTINLFYLAGVGLNLLTLAGLALGFGMMVDNSIVVLENFQHHRESGLGLHESAERGAREVSLPIIAATLTTVAAFIPFLYLTGELRIYYLSFALAVGLALLASLLAAFTFIPALTVWLVGNFDKGKPGTKNLAAETEATKKVNTRYPPKKDVQKDGFYARILILVLRHKFLTLLLTLAAFAGSYFLFDKYVTKGQIWSWGEDTYLMVFINMPTGAELERTDEIVNQFEKNLIDNPNIDKIYTQVTPEFARLQITFPPPIQRSVYPLLLKEQLTYLATQIAGPAVGVYGYGHGFYSGGGTAPQYRLQVLGYNYSEVKRIAEALGQKLARHPRVGEVNTNSTLNYRRDDLFEIVLQVNRKALQRFHLTAAEVLNAIQSYLRETLSWQRINLAGKEIDYRIKMQGYREFNLEDLNHLLLRTPMNEKVRLSEVAKIHERKVLAEIRRQDQQYLRGVSFEYRGPWKFGDRLVENLIQNSQLPPGYKLQRASFFFLSEIEKRQIYLVLGLALLLVFMVTAGLFESLIQPFIVMLTVPLALIGVFLIFYLTDTNFDRSAYIGVILLAGIVVNNSIILIHHLNDLRRRGLALLDAVIQGARDRLRPILMTSLTTVFGLLPLLLFANADDSIWYALSLATIGGVLSSTFLVLLVIPVLYAAVENRKLQKLL